MSIKEISFDSKNKRDVVKGWIYTPITEPKAVIQLIHGFGEHSRRYLHMIDKFLEAGFIVAADDHIGHGKTGYDSNTLGNPGTIGLDGFKVYQMDEKTLHDAVKSVYPTLPYFVFGHSWGSMIARAYAADFGSDLAGLMLCGVVSQLKGGEMLRNSKEFETGILNNQGLEKGLDWLVKLFCDMTSRYKNPSSPNDWIALDNNIVKDHANDMFNCFDVNKQLIFDVLQLYKYIECKEWIEKIDPKLPVYLIGGDLDPCGNYGEGLYHVANMFGENKNPTKVKIYNGYRHEIHNERAIRDEVERGLTDFVCATLS